MLTVRYKSLVCNIQIEDPLETYPQSPSSHACRPGLKIHRKSGIKLSSLFIYLVFNNDSAALSLGILSCAHFTFNCSINLVDWTCLHQIFFWTF